MSFIEFLKFVAIIKMLYGRDVAENIFAKNIHKYYNLNSEGLNNLVRGEVG